MDAAYLRKALALIAKGIVEKEQLLNRQPARYPYSKTLQHGMQMFLAAKNQMNQTESGAVEFADETAFLNQFITKPIAEWFCGWEAEAFKKLDIQGQPFYSYEAFAYCRKENIFTPSEECYEFLQTQESDIMAGTDERVLYEKILALNQEDYCTVRQFIIEHPIIKLEQRRAVLLAFAGNRLAQDAIEFAYEQFTGEGYKCPACGWTLTKGRYGLNCHSSHCMDILPELTEELKLNPAAEPVFRLKKGVMRYFAQPGKLELAIVEFCKKKKVCWSLWPYKDRYDVEIVFPDGEIWEIDAKAYRNPLSLRMQIQNDGGFSAGEFSKGYFVIPTEFTANQKNYTAIVNKALTGQKNVKCITLRTLKTEINRKVAACLAS